jgi:hypothetical protein
MIVASIATDEFRDFRDRTFPNKKAYCERHGYTFYGGTTHIHRMRPVSWSKIKLLEALCFQYPDEWAFWTDADAIFTRPDWKATEIIDPKADLIISRDVNGINCGSFLIRLNVQSQQFLADVYDQVQFIHHAWWEQAAMIYLLQLSYPIKVKYVEKTLINAYPQDFKQGYSAVLHVPAPRPRAARLEELKKKLDAM